MLADAYCFGMAADPSMRDADMRNRQIRKLRILGYSSLFLALVVAVLMFSTGNVPVGIFVLVLSAFLGLSLWWIERSLKRDVDPL